MAKQDEKQRQRRRLQERAIEMAATNIWAEAVEINKQILAMGEDTDTYNRLGKAYLELGQYTQSHDCYQHALRLTPTNSIARKNLARLDILLARGVEQG